MPCLAWKAVLCLYIAYMIPGLQAKEASAPPERDIVAEARAAAAASDEEEGVEGAAARAAARAASLGLAAASTGYASLGGVDDHVSTDTNLYRGARAPT